jgi:hypothetical protein
MDVIRFRCSSCQQPLKIGADKAGHRVKCRCGTALTVPGTRPSRPPAEEQPPGSEDEVEQSRASTAEEKPQPTTVDEDATSPETGVEEGNDQHEVRKKRRRGRARRPPGDWDKVRVGLLLLLVGMGLSLVSSVLLQLLFLVAGFKLGWLMTLMVIWVSWHFLLTLGEAAAFALCLFVPNERGARTLVFFALVLGPMGDLLSELLSHQMFSLSQRLLESIQSGDLAGLTAMLLSAIAALNRYIVWATFLSLLTIPRLFIVPLFLRSLGRTLQKKDLEEPCENLLKLNAIVAFIHLAFNLLFRTGVEGLGFVLMPLGCITPLIDLARQGLQMWILFRLYQTLGKGRKRR